MHQRREEGRESGVATLNMSEASPSPIGAFARPSPEKPAVPDHELLRRIGSGSYGDVWLARSVTGAYRAVKLVYQKRFEDARPFEREFKGIQKFEPISRSHSSQLAILHVGRSEGFFYYSMELADSAQPDSPPQPGELKRANESPLVLPETYRPRTLRYELQQRGPIPVDECLEIALSLTTALVHLHKKGLIHRDIKPSNIIFVGGIPKLADIGLVTGVDGSLSFVGTEGFVPPEGPGTPQADIYSLGKVIYEMCTGRDRQDFPELPTQLRASPDQEALIELNEIVLKACERNPRERYQTAEELHAELGLLQAGKSVRRARGLERRLALAKRFAAIVGAVAVLALLILHQSKHAEKSAREQILRLDELHGMHLLDEGDIYGSILWLSRALEAGSDDPLQTEINRIRIGTSLGAAPALMQMLFHNGIVRRVVFSPDGSKIASASADHTAMIWDVRNGTPLIRPIQHEDEVRDIEFSADGKWIATASNDGTAGIWDASTGLPTTPRLRHRSFVYRATFHPNRPFIATCSEDHTARIWDALTGRPIGPVLEHSDRVKCVRFNVCVNGGAFTAARAGRGLATMRGGGVNQPLVSVYGCAASGF